MVEGRIYFIVMGRMSSDLFKWKEYLPLNAVMPSAFQKIKYQINILQIFVTVCPVGRKGMSNHYARLLKQDVTQPNPVATRSKTWVSGRWGFESRRGHGYLSLVIVVCCQAEVSATGRSLVQRTPTDCVCVCVCVLLNAIKCSNKPVNLQRVDIRGRLRKKGSKNG